jgi:hypothetical protein
MKMNAQLSEMVVWDAGFIFLSDRVGWQLTRPNLLLLWQRQKHEWKSTRFVTSQAPAAHHNNSTTRPIAPPFASLPSIHTQHLYGQVTTRCAFVGASYAGSLASNPRNIPSTWLPYPLRLSTPTEMADPDGTRLRAQPSCAVIPHCRRCRTPKASRPAHCRCETWAWERTRTTTSNHHPN